MAGSYVRTKEHRERISVKMKALWKTSRRKMLAGLAKREKLYGEKNPMFGKHLSEKAKKKLSEKQKVRWCEPSYRKQAIENVKAEWQRPRFKERMIVIRNEPESKENMAKQAKARWQDPEFKRRMAKIFSSPEHRQKLSIAGTGRAHSEASRKQISESQKILWAEPNYRKVRGKKASDRLKRAWSGPYGTMMRELWKDPERRKTHCENISRGVKQLWFDEDFRTSQLQAMFRGLGFKPTHLEKHFMAICEKYDLPFKYVGDGKFFVGTKNPDFVHTKGLSVCVEVANTYEGHHAKDYPIVRKKYFADHGWDCIVFMGNELDENVVMNQLSPFVENR